MICCSTKFLTNIVTSALRRDLYQVDLRIGRAKGVVTILLRKTL